MQNENFIKDITSKDTKLSQNIIKNIIESQDIEAFRLLCNSADFIFPFLKERISCDFIKLIEEKNLDTILKFSKIYCIDFEDIIIKSWLKFANQDLTDEILNLFEEGTQEQKAYCAKYFCHIQDPLALEFLNKYALCEYEPLKTNCALALAKFNDVEILNEMKNIILSDNEDEFEELNAFNFISTYGGDEQIKFVAKHFLKSPFYANIISNILDNYDINHLKNILDEDVLLKILFIIIDEYPENIPLDTCYYWNLIEYIKLIQGYNHQFANNILLIAKKKFEEFSENDIYSFDFDKNTKNEIKSIANYLNSLNLSFKEFEGELNTQNYDFQFNIAMEVIRIYQLKEYSKKLADIFNSKILTYEQMANYALVLKELNSIDLLDKNIIDEIKNENIKALIKSYL